MIESTIYSKFIAPLVMGIGWPLVILETQISFQRQTRLPLRTYQLAPFIITSRPSKRINHIHEAQPPLFTSKNEELAKYGALKTGAHNELGSWIRCQFCLARKARLKSLKFLNPMPPSHLGNPMSRQLTSGYPGPCSNSPTKISWLPHQYLCIAYPGARRRSLDKLAAPVPLP